MLKIIDSKRRISMPEAEIEYRDCNYLMINIEREDFILYGYVYAISDSIESDNELLTLERGFSEKEIPTLIGGEYRKSLNFDHLEMVPVA